MTKRIFGTTDMSMIPPGGRRRAWIATDKHLVADSESDEFPNALCGVTVMVLPPDMQNGVATCQTCVDISRGLN